VRAGTASDVERLTPPPVNVTRHAPAWDPLFPIVSSDRNRAPVAPVTSRTTGIVRACGFVFATKSPFPEVPT
jgi:hypothetical protein